MPHMELSIIVTVGRAWCPIPLKRKWADRLFRRIKLPYYFIRIGRTLECRAITKRRLLARVTRDDYFKINYGPEDIPRDCIGILKYNG